MLRIVILAAFVQLVMPQQYQQKVAPGVPPQNYQNYQQPPPPPQPHGAPVPQQQYQQQQQYQPPPQQFQPPPQQQMPVQQPHVPVQQQHVPLQQQHHNPHGEELEHELLNPSNMEHEREHIQEHMDVPIDTSKMSEQELQFHYFKMHDADNNNKLDGCELIKSLIHWHGKIDKTHRAYTDKEIEEVLEIAITNTDLNKDGYVDYLEYRISNYKAEQAKKKNDDNKI